MELLLKKLKQVWIDRGSSGRDSGWKRQVILQKVQNEFVWSHGSAE